MALEFDPEKDVLNVAKHGVSLARATELDVRVVVQDGRYAEARSRAYGFLDDLPYCLAFVFRGETIRAISLRRAHLREFKRYVPTDEE